MWFQRTRNRLAIVMIPLAWVIVGCSGTGTGGDDVDITDGTAPWIITDLSVADFTSSTVTLTWTATGDDSTSGTASSYDIRRSGSVIGFVEFDSAVQIPNPPTPKPSGETETWTVTGLSTDSTYYFAIKAFDEEDNWQGVSNCVSATCIDDYIVSFADAGLLAAVRSTIGISTGNIYKSDLLDMDNLTAIGFGISDLTGIQHCDALTFLNLNDNGLSDIGLLVNLTELRELHLGQNDIQSISAVASLTRLQVLMVGDNEIDDIVPLTSLADLRFLGIYNNEIDNLSPLVANTDFASGDTVYIDGNPWTHESINSSIPALEARGVKVYYTPDVTPPNQVTTLAVDSVGEHMVRLTWTAPGGDSWAGQAFVYDLRYSSDSTTLAAWTDATVADGLPDPEPSGTVQTATITGLEADSTYYFALRSADRSLNWSDISNFVSATPFVDEPITIPDANLLAALRTALSIPTGDIHRSELMTLTELDADAAGITDLTGLEYCLGLEALSLRDNYIVSLEPLSGLTGLLQLQLENNDITDISSLADLHALIVLQLTGNPISDLTPLSGLSELWFLSLITINTSDMSPLTGLTNLEYLLVVGNGITDISFVASCPAISSFYATNNSITDLSPLTNLSNLSVVDLQYNQVTDVAPLVSNVGLGSGDTINLQHNPLSTESINTHIPALQARGVTVTY